MSGEIDFVSTLVKAKDRVEYILEHHPKARDNDKYLYLVYLRVFCGGIMRGEMTFDQFAAWVMSREVPMPETVRRVRAKAQEEGRWRGEKYEARHRAAPAVAEWAVGSTLAPAGTYNSEGEFVNGDI